jgi:hypothetical protein
MATVGKAAQQHHVNPSHGATRPSSCHLTFRLQVEAKCDREAAVVAKKAARDAEREAAKALSQEERRFAREVKRCAKLGLPPPSPMPKCAALCVLPPACIASHDTCFVLVGPWMPAELLAVCTPSLLGQVWCAPCSSLICAGCRPPSVQPQQQARPLAAPKLAPFNSEDMLLPGAHRKPPSPEPLTQGVATPSALAGVEYSRALEHLLFGCHHRQTCCILYVLHWHESACALAIDCGGDELSWRYVGIPVQRQWQPWS